MAESPDCRSLVSASSQLNLMEIEAVRLRLTASVFIDDKEFDIPQVDTPPTLESILNEPEDEDEPFILEDTCLLNTENIDAHSCETSSLASSDSGDLEMNATVHGSVLRRNVLKGISAQIVSAAVRLTTVSNVIAVGTSHGLVLVFDQNQALRLCLGTTATGAEYGAVSALSINHDCTRLLCGFAKGQITMWDLANGKLLRTITDAHPPGTAILHVKFTDHPALAVCNDSGGSVFELSFRRVMGMRTCESRCLFSGSKGEVCCVEPLHAGLELKDHPISQYSLLAMASLTKILLIGLKPSLKVWMTFPYGKTDPASVPLLAWQFVAVQKTINPVLAFCRGDTIHFLLVKKDESGTIHVIKQRQLQLNCDLISLSWINPRTLVLMDSTEKLRVVDRPSQEELETVDMAELQLVYNSSHFKSLATGGNVSQALALVGEKTCYQSVCSYAGQIMYLGTKSVHIMTLRNWRERVDHLLKQEKFMEALSLAWSFHEGTAKAVLGLFADPAKRKGVVADKMVEILLQYVDRSLKKCPEQGKIQVMEQHFQVMVPVMVDYCLLLQRTDLLFNQIYPRLVENSVARGVFLESLEPYILSERIGCLTAAVMRDLLSYFQENGMMDSVEGCLVHMDITNLDIQQVVQMCWDNQLYDAMIYVFNSGMNDYIMLDDGKCNLRPNPNSILYPFPFPCCAFYVVSLNVFQVFEFLIRLHSVEAAQEEEVYPYIRTLLHFDTREFLNVLALTFEDFKNDKQALEYQQRIVDILLKVMVDNSDFTPSQVGCLFTFLARQLAKPDNTLFVNRKLFDQVLEFLCSPDDDSRHTERQQVLLELLQVGGVVQFDEERLLDLAEKAEFYQICEFMYDRKHLYNKIVDCYLKDPLRKEELFNYIHNILSMPGYSSEEKQLVWVKALQHVKVSQTRLQMICPLEHTPGREKGLNPQTVLRLGPDLHELLVDLQCQFSPQQVTAFLKTSQDYRLEEAIQITEKHKLHEATAYLLEKKGDVQGAFEVLLQGELHKLALEGSEADKPDGEEEESDEVQSLLRRVEEALHDIIALCQRSSHGLNQQQREKHWCIMNLAKCSVSPDCFSLSSALKELTMKVLNSMSSFIAPPAIIQRILQDPVYGKGKLAEIQGLILGMLETFNYEQVLMKHFEMHLQSSEMSVGIKCQNEITYIICGHLYHCQCLQRKEVGVLTEGCVRTLECYGSVSMLSCYVGMFFSLQMLSEATLDAQQTQAWDHFRTLYRGPSRLAVLTELTHSHGNERPGLSNPVHPGTGSIYHSENFQLKLSPPPLVEE
uniref:VPS8 subunit of CORVET complex n=1 Tax=Cyprinus carpio TaxID=7962 RepID=A0A8C2PQC2_CYPCA